MKPPCPTQSFASRGVEKRYTWKCKPYIGEALKFHLVQTKLR